MYVCKWFVWYGVIVYLYVWVVWLCVVYVYVWCVIVYEMCDCGVVWRMIVCVCVCAVIIYIYVCVCVLYVHGVWVYMKCVMYRMVWLWYDIIIWCICYGVVCGMMYTLWYGVWYAVYVVVWCVVWCIHYGMVCDEKSMLTCIMGLHQSWNTQDYLLWVYMDSLPWTAHTPLTHQSMQFVNKERYISSVYFHTSVSNTDRQLSLVYISSGIIQFLVDMYNKCNPSCKQATSWQVQHIFLDKSSIYSLTSPAHIPWQVQYIFSHELHVQVSLIATFPVHSPSFFSNLSLLSFSYG